MRSFLLYTFTFVTLFCCSSSRGRISSSAMDEGCKLHRQEFSIDASTYKEFSVPLSAFLHESKNRLDVLFINMKGGNHSASEMKRWVITQDSIYKKVWSNGEQKIHSLGVNFEKALQMSDSIENGDFLQVCPYSTSNDSFLILIKSDSVLKFKYSSVEKDYHGLSIKERNKIVNVMSLLAYLNDNHE